jgi:hypothetical protein
VCLLVDVYKDWGGAGLRDGFHRSDEGVRYGDDGVPGTDACRDEGKAKSIGTAVHAHAVLAPAEGGEFLLEGLHLRAADERGGFKSIAEDLNKLFFQGLVLERRSMKGITITSG